MTGISIREEEQDDWPAIAALEEAAFGRPDEARLVDRLRSNGDLVLSLVAQAGAKIVGHLALSRMAAPFLALGLGPLAVAPDLQRSGVGGRLTEAALERARADGWDAVFVLGEPAYYRRFGFSAQAAIGFASPYAGPYLMALSLKGALPVSSGTIEYAPAFAALE